MQNIVIKKDTELKKQNKHWQFCVGSGHASLALRADYMKLLKECVQDLGFQRVRFHGIFCDDMHTYHTFEDIFPIPMETGIEEKSFRLCKIAYDNLLECGVKPFVELGFMPGHMAKEDVRGIFFYKPNICLPKSDEDWTAYIQDFIRFLIHHYGREEIESWHFEVWNEPDLVIPFFRGTKEEYFHLYAITAQAIKEIDDKIQVGGPATSGSKWIASFVEFCEKNNVPCDFVTTHQYAGDPLGGISDQGGPEENSDDISEEIPSEDGFTPEVFGQLLGAAPRDAILPAFRMMMGDPLEKETSSNHVFYTNANIVKKQAKEKPVFYTEWNTCATFSAYSNDTRKVAAYDAQTALELDGVIDGSSIWCFCDIFEELHPFPEEFHGGFGLMTQSGIKKPVYHALKMLADAGDERYVIPVDTNEEIFAAAFKKDATIQIMLIRQKMQNLFDMPKESIHIEIELDEAPGEVTLERIDGSHCNPLAIWEEMGMPQVPTRQELQEIKDKSAMQKEELDYHYTNGMLSVEAALGVNDMYFIQIQTR